MIQHHLLSLIVQSKRQRSLDPTAKRLQQEIIKQSSSISANNNVQRKESGIVVLYSQSAQSKRICVFSKMLRHTRPWCAHLRLGKYQEETSKDLWLQMIPSGQFKSSPSVRIPLYNTTVSTCRCTVSSILLAMHEQSAYWQQWNK